MYKIRTLNSKSGTALLAGLLSSALPLTDLIAQEQQLADSTGQPTVLEEVVVTANKRTENVQNVAASVSVRSGDLLLARHQEQLSDYANYIPGLNVSNLGKAGLASVNLRGIASVSNSASVGTYVGEIPLGSSSRWGNASNQIADVLPYDMERLEVLRGPQGTLYGAGSMGGLIKYVLKSADSSEFSGQVGGDLGYLDGAGNLSYSIRGAVNIPVVKDVLGLRVSAYDKYLPGYIDNVIANAPNSKDANRQVLNGGRVALMWQPVEQLSVELGAILSRNDAKDGGTISYAGFTPVPTTDGSAIGVVSEPFGDLTQSHAFPQAFHAEVDLYTATINWHAGSLDVVSATGWSNQHTRTSVDQTTAIRGTPILPVGSLLGGQTEIEVEKFTQELRLVSPQGGVFEWMVGGFYTDEEVTSDLSLSAFTPTYDLFIDPLLTNNERSTFKEYAFFGNTTWNLSEQFDLSAGLRYAENEQVYNGVPGGPIGGPPTIAPKSSEGVTTWSLASRYRFTPDAMLYARIATGYRPGGRNSSVLSVPGDLPPTVDSDTLISYELGVKSEFPEHRAILNMTAFFIDWKDIQLNSTAFGSTILTNGGKAESKGFEFEGSYSPVDGLILGLNAAYTDSELTSVRPGAFFLPGYQLPGVPKLSYSVTADYDWPVMNNWQAHIGGGFRWVDELWLTGVQLAGRAAPAVVAPSYSLVNIYASLSRGPYTFKFFVNNLTNKRAIQGGLELINLFNQPQQGDFWIVQPMAMGVGFDYRF